MGFFASLVVSLVFAVVGELLRPKPKLDKLKPSSLGDFDFPTSDATRTIPVWGGTCKFKGPNVPWFGDLKVVKRTKRVKTGWFSSTKQDLGFNYYLGVQMVFGWGGDDVVLVDFTVGEDEKCLLDSVAVTDHGDYYSFTMNSPDILEGTEDFPNGVKGPVKIYKGTRTQNANAYLTSKWGLAEGDYFRGVFYAVLEQCYLGNNDTPPVFVTTAKRCMNQLGVPDGAHDVNGDANIACWAYEIFTEDSYYGLSVPPARIDAASFIACAQTMYGEGIGISMIQEESVSGREFLAEMLRHADGVIYNDPETTLWTMALARADYDVEFLPVFDASNIDLDSYEFGRVSYAETRNVTSINYTDRAKGFIELPVEHMDEANVFARDGVIDAESIDFLGFSNSAQARWACARVSKTRGAPLARAEFRAKRGAATKLRPGSVLKLSRPDLGYTNLVMRVLKVNWGSAGSEWISVSCMEDIFAVNNIAFDEPADSGWVPLYEASSPLADARLVEAPYEMLDSENRHVMVLGVRDEGVTEGFQVWTAETEAEYYRQTNTAYGTVARGDLLADFTEFDATGELTIENAIDPELLETITAEDAALGRNLMLIDDEFFAWESVTDNLDGTYTIGGLVPAIFDTVRRSHVAGSKVYFFNESVTLTDEVPYDADVALLARLPTFARGEVAALGTTIPYEITTASRAQRPNPPGKVRINDAPYAAALSIAATYVNITWQDRDKTHVGVVAQDDDSVGETGVKATVLIEDADTNTVLWSASGIVSPVTFSCAVDTNVRVTLGAIDFDGQESLQKQVLEFEAQASSAGDTFHAIYDVAFEPEDNVEEIMSVGGELIIDCSLADQFRTTLHENTTAKFINVPVEKIALLEVRNPANWTLVFDSSVTPFSGESYVATPGGTALVPKVDNLAFKTVSGGVLWVLRVDYDVNPETNVPVDQEPLSVAVTPNPAYNHTASNPSQAVVAAASGGDGIYTYAWERAPGGIGDWSGSATNVGGPDFTITNAAIANPTFSRAGSSAIYTAQNWRVTATETSSGRTAQAILEIGLESGAGGLGGPCVSVKAWLPGVKGKAARQARDILVGDEIIVIDPTTLRESLAMVSYSETKQTRGVLVYTANGVALTCSYNAPLPVRSGGRRIAEHMYGEQTLVKVLGRWIWSTVIQVKDMGQIDVQHITAQNNFFPAGDEPGEYMAHHNLKYNATPFDGEVV